MIIKKNISELYIMDNSTASSIHKLKIKYDYLRLKRREDNEYFGEMFAILSQKIRISNDEIARMNNEIARMRAEIANISENKNRK